MIWSLIIGVISGYIASQMMGKQGSLLKYLILGTLGSLVGGFLGGLIGLHATGFIARILLSVVGAYIFMYFAKMFID